ncbi:MAG: DUF5060 domain-containing protein, partial [Bacteroidetes bacterium]|nr:DUF5060 domain-containing protein [Bacteroidota bacterium]
MVLSQSATTFSGNGTLSGEAKVWHKVTITFNGPQTFETDSVNPFMDYRLNVLFSHADTSYEVPGFYAADGNAAETSTSSGNKWQVHFAPDREGAWTYTASFRRGNEIAISTLNNAGTPVYFDGATGVFFVSPSDKSVPDLRAKGRLAYVGSRYRQHLGSGEYFIKGGTDSPENFLSYDDFDNTPNIDNLRKSWSPHLSDWQPGDPAWQNGKGKGIIGAINYLSSKRINAFSFLTLGHLGDDKNVYPWVDPTEPLVYDVSKLAQWEIVFEHADHKGMFMHIKTTERENVDYLDNGALGPERKLYHRELIARFGHHLALNWNTGEENDQGTERQKAYAQHLHDTDPYKHLIVMHTSSNHLNLYFTPLLGDSSKLTGASVNTHWTNVHKETEKWVRLSEQSGKPWIVSNDEQNPPNRGVLPDAGYMGQSASTQPNINHTRANIIWGSLMAGSSGSLYYFGYNYPDSDLLLQNYRSRDKLYEHTLFALDFFRDYLPFQEMTNLDSLIGNPNHNGGEYCFGKAGEIYAVYMDNGGPIDLMIEGDTAVYSVQWYNPRTGEGLTNGEFTQVNGPGLVNLGNPPVNSNDDWVALVKKTTPFTSKSYSSLCITDSVTAWQIDSFLTSPGLSTLNYSSPLSPGSTTPFETLSFPSFITNDSISAQRIDSFFHALGLTNAYYPSPYISDECAPVDTTCLYLTVSAGPDQTLNCADSSFILTATSNSGMPSFYWTALSGDISSSFLNDSIWVEQIGSYVVTVTDSTGCFVSDTINVKADISLAVDAGPDQSLSCITGTATLAGTVSNGGTISWTGPNGFGSADSTPVVSDSGYYILTIFSPSGCSGSDTVFVAGNDSIPNASAGPDKILDCNTTSVVLDGSQNSAATISWTGPNGFTSNLMSPSVTEQGKYTITITNALGCSAIDQVNVLGDFSGEFTDAGPDQELNCNNVTITLDASNSDPGTYSWTGPNGFSSNLVDPTITEPGVYTLTNTGANGCIATDDVVVTSNFALPFVDAGPDMSIGCSLTSATLDGTNSDSGLILWSGPNGFTSSILNPVVNDTGMYVLTITATNGCFNTDTAYVTGSLLPPLADAGDQQMIDCNNASIILNGWSSISGTYLWTGPNGFSSISVNPTVSQPGMYFLIVTGANGCVATDSVLVGQNFSAPIANAGSNQIINCNNPSVILDGSNSDPGTYLWTGPNGFTSILVNPTASESGVYTLSVTGANGCIGTDTVIILG